MNNENNYIESEVEKYYQREDKIYRQITERGFANYVTTLENLPQAFRRKQNCICCMDEGTPWGMHIAGSGILMSPADLQDYYNQTKPDEITSHDGCGAARIYNESQDLPSENPDEAGKKWAQKLAKRFGIKHRHIVAEEMKRPSEGHFARICYYDLTGSFNYGGIAGLPAGFVISRKFITPEYAQKEVAVALSISFGDHGLGNRLSFDQPFYLVAIAEDEGDLVKLKAELAKPSESYGNKIKIAGFVKPFVRYS